MTNEIPNLSPVLDDLMCVADSKWLLGHWYILVLRNGRNLPDFNALSGMSQDELGHTRAVFNFLEAEHGDALPVKQLEFDRAATEVHSMALLDEPPADWTDFVITAYLAETAIWRLFSTFQGSTHPALDNMVAQFGQESRFHQMYCSGWLQALDDEDLGTARAALHKRLPLVLAWFGDATNADEALENGLRSMSVAEARTEFLEGDVQDLVEMLGLADAPLPAAAETGNWDGARRRPADTAMPAQLWEFVVPTNYDATIARRPLQVSVQDNVLGHDAVDVSEHAL